MSGFAIAALIIGALAGVPIVLRPWAVYRLHKQIGQSAEAMLKEANRRESSTSQEFGFFYDLMIWYAAAIPLVASDHLRMSHHENNDSEASPEILGLKEYLNQNGWMLRYIFVMVGCINIAQYLAEPWRPRRLFSTVLWLAFFKVLYPKKINYSLTPETAAKAATQLEETKKETTERRRSGELIHA